MESGGDGIHPEGRLTDRQERMGRRPTIRRRPISTPRVRSEQVRTAPFALPGLTPTAPPRAPLPRLTAPARPRLVLVEEEEEQFAAPIVRPLAAELAPRQSGRGMVVAMVVVCAMVAGIGVAWLSSRRADVAEQPAVVATTTLNAGVVPAAAPTTAPRAPSPHAPAVLEVDVNSLPAAPARGPVRGGR